MNKLLIDKYRPQSLDDIILDKFIKKKINRIIEEKNIPNIVLTGSQSNGKSSLINIMVKNIYDYHECDDHILELNASDDRGLSIINTNIIPFLRKKKNKKKLIILEEADSITNKAQNLFSSIISEYSSTCSFIFISNERFKIHETIQSKCILLILKPIQSKYIIKQLKYICDQENITYTLDGLNELLYISDNDFRKSINNLECFKYLKEELNLENINKLFNLPKLNLIQQIIDNTINKKLVENLKIINKLYSEGYNSNDIILSFLKYIRYDIVKNLDGQNKIYIYKLLCDCYIKLNEGNDSKLQIFSCICNIYLFFNNNNLNLE